MTAALLLSLVLLPISVVPEGGTCEGPVDTFCSHDDAAGHRDCAVYVSGAGGYACVKEGTVSEACQHAPSYCRKIKNLLEVQT